ncbi:MAG: VCBS repeat-containing protein [Okeania sp. SIO3B3]|nr:VCBS repeat-containing protein [Okeania sp. SIO3B3]
MYQFYRADFNRDSILDLATTQFINGSFTSLVSVYLGNGTGGFSTPTQYNTGGNAVDVEAGDFNIDLTTAYLIPD